MYIKIHCLTRQIHMKPFKTIIDPEAFKVAADDTRRKIIHLLRAKEMTVSQIADELDLTPQTVYHHIKKLCDANMVEVEREVRVDHLIESYYRATAEVFHFTVGKETKSKETLVESVKMTLQTLKKMGYNIKYDDKAISEIADLTMELDDCCIGKELEEAVTNLDADFFTKQDVQEYASLLTMTDEQLAKQDQIRRKFRKALKALLVK